MHSQLALLFLLFGLGSVACGGAQAPAESAPETPSPAEPAPEAPGPAEPTEETADEPTQAPPTEHGSAEDAGGGRLAFVTCEEPRSKACTKELRPVCADVDTGVRCVTTPCPSTERKTYGNPCMACADPKVLGYFPRGCDELNTEAAP